MNKITILQNLIIAKALIKMQNFLQKPKYKELKIKFPIYTQISEKSK